MKKLYYLVATTIVVGAIFFFGTNRSEASSVVDELQRSNLEVLSSESHYVSSRCFLIDDTGKTDDNIFHKCGDITNEGRSCYVGYTTVTRFPLYYIQCFLIPRE